jgi:hypothetical protein
VSCRSCRGALGLAGLAFVASNFLQPGERLWSGYLRMELSRQGQGMGSCALDGRRRVAAYLHYILSVGKGRGRLTAAVAFRPLSVRLMFGPKGAGLATTQNPQPGRDFNPPSNCFVQPQGPPLLSSCWEIVLEMSQTYSTSARRGRIGRVQIKGGGEGMAFCCLSGICVASVSLGSVWRMRLCSLLAATPGAHRSSWSLHLPAPEESLIEVARRARQEAPPSRPMLARKAATSECARCHSRKGWCG